jgi:stage V sporulation protein G
MEITRVRITLVKKPEKNLLAFADITLDECFVVNSIRIIDGRNGLFVAMPSRKREDGSWQDIAHPITGDFRKQINDTVLNEYEATLARGAGSDDDTPF